MVNFYLFNHYVNLLCHPNERQREDTLQDLFFTLLNGDHLHPDQWESLIPLLVYNATSRNDDLRRWSYQVGVFSRNNNKMLVDYCMSNLSSENNMLNRTWIIALLAENLSAKELNGIISNADHGLTNENIDLARYLFSECPEIDFKKVLNHADPLSMMWTASIGAYKNIAIENNKEPFVTTRELSIMTAETDNDEVLKHVMYAFFLQDTFSIQELYFNPHDYDKMGNQQKKWLFTLLWRDFEYMSNNIDFVKELLSKKHLFSNMLSDKSGNEVRIGLARGLANAPFLKDISSAIVDWYSHEDSPSTRYHLSKYIKANRTLESDFMEIFEHLKVHGDDSLRSLMLLNEQRDTQGLIAEPFPLANRLPFGPQLQFIAINNIFNFKEGTNMKQEYHHVNQVNNFEGNDNQAIYFQSDVDSLKTDLSKLMSNATENEKALLQTAMESIEKKDESGFKSALKKLVDIGSNIFSKVSADFIVAYMRAHGVMP